MSIHTVSTAAELRAIYGTPPPNSLALRCVIPRLDKHHRAFIALSPFVVIASTDARGLPDVSPRGDLPGFVAVLDEHTLLLPDRPGNKKLLTLSNILENPNVALLFLVPGREDSLRVSGRAQITTEPTLLAPLAVQGKRPRSALIVTVEQAWLHCGKALIRSRLWEAQAQVAPDALPTFGRMLADQIAGVDAAQTDARIEHANKNKLWDEPSS
ncbi:MAG: pyridoxamine 5'-phosphate oxidase family protein [Burkholderiales bacterium]